MVGLYVEASINRLDHQIADEADDQQPAMMYIVTL